MDCGFQNYVMKQKFISKFSNIVRNIVAIYVT